MGARAFLEMEVRDHRQTEHEGENGNGEAHQAREKALKKLTKSNRTQPNANAESDFGSEGWGFESLRARQAGAPSNRWQLDIRR